MTDDEKHGRGIDVGGSAVLQGAQASRSDGAASPIRILAIASGGGHFIQLCRLMPSWIGTELHLATTDAGLVEDARAACSACGISDLGFHTVKDANRNQKIQLLLSTFQIVRLVLRLRPDFVVSTGAAPGYLALRFGKLIGARTIWVDSIANAEELSLSGRKAGAIADLWLTQWPHLAQDDGPSYRGSVL